MAVLRADQSGNLHIRLSNHKSDHIESFYIQGLLGFQVVDLEVERGEELNPIDHAQYFDFDEES